MKKIFLKSTIILLIQILLLLTAFIGCSDNSIENDDNDQNSNAAGLFITTTDLQRAKNRISNMTEPFYSSYENQRNRANSALSETADPFHMDTITDITFYLDDPPSGADDTLGEAVSKYTTQSNYYRILALEYALTNNQTYADKALEMMLDWANENTVVNLYDFHPDFVNATFDGMTSGFHSDRPWNFALEIHWLGYGLTNTCDAYLLLKLNGYNISPSDDSTLRAWILEVAESVNSSLHAWTKYADNHDSNPNDATYIRYRTDNHLTWALSGLISAAAALNDNTLANYVLSGGSWYDSRAGAYSNPSYIKDIIDRAIESGTGAANEGRIFEELIMRDPPVGYSFFHLWAMILVAQIADVHFNEDVWTYTGSDNGNMELAFDRYASYILGDLVSPGSDGDLTGNCWMFELAYRKWNKSRYSLAIQESNRLSFINQSIGPVLILLGEDL